MHLPINLIFYLAVVLKGFSRHINTLQGMIFLTLSVSVLKHKTLFFLALYVLSIGDGGHKPCVQTFAADQFDDDTPEEKDAKSSFFNWWYLGIVAGSCAAVFVVIYLQVIKLTKFLRVNILCDYQSKD